MINKLKDFNKEIQSCTNNKKNNYDYLNNLNKKIKNISDKM